MGSVPETRLVPHILAGNRAFWPVPVGLTTAPWGDRHLAKEGDCRIQCHPEPMWIGFKPREMVLAAALKIPSDWISAFLEDDPKLLDDIEMGVAARDMQLLVTPDVVMCRLCAGDLNDPTNVECLPQTSEAFGELPLPFVLSSATGLAKVLRSYRRPSRHLYL